MWYYYVVFGNLMPCNSGPWHLDSTYQVNIIINSVRRSKFRRTSEDYKLWRQAADFINTEDSRVRTEIRLIDGIESNVWIWSTHVTGGWAGSGKLFWKLWMLITHYQAFLNDKNLNSFLILKCLNALTYWPEHGIYLLVFVRSHFITFYVCLVIKCLL